MRASHSRTQQKKPSVNDKSLNVTARIDECRNSVRLTQVYMTESCHTYWNLKTAAVAAVIDAKEWKSIWKMSGIEQSPLQKGFVSHVTLTHVSHQKLLGRTI
jgi:hypothetical protein